jgi:hypothetical protein
LQPPVYKKRAPRPCIVDHFETYLRERLAAYPALTAVRLWREFKERGFAGGYSVVRDRVRELRPSRPAGFKVRFEVPAGEQAQVDFARFEVEFVDELGVKRIIWLFSMVLGYSRLIWARFVVHQDLQTVLRCHSAALEAIGGVPREILYDRMKAAVLGEDAEGLVVYNRALVDLARHYGFQPRACRPYRAKTNGKRHPESGSPASVRCGRTCGTISARVSGYVRPLYLPGKALGAYSADHGLKGNPSRTTLCTNSQFEIHEISIETLELVAGGSQGDGSGTGTGQGGYGLARVIRGVVEPVVDAVGTALGTIVHIL